MIEESLKRVSENFLARYGIRKKHDYFDVLVPYLLKNKDLSIRINKKIENLNCKDMQIIMFAQNFNESLDPDDIPPSIRVLIFGNHFNQSLDNLPPTIEVIIFPNYSNFNWPLNNLPVKLKAIIFGKNYNQNLNLLPSSLLFVEFPLYSQYSTVIFPPYI